VPRAQTQAHKCAPAAVYTANEGAVYVSPDPEPAGACIWFFTRLGGVSERPYDSLNASKAVGDEPAAVEENLSTIREALERRPRPGSARSRGTAWRGCRQRASLGKVMR
jgi:hypothetical protein